MVAHIRSEVSHICSRAMAAMTGLLLAGTAFAGLGALAAQDNSRLSLDLVWSIDGGPYGSSRSLEPTLAITSEQVLIDANVTKGERRHEVIRAFDIGTGRPGSMIEHPDGEPFEGLGDAIAHNDQFIVTALSRKAQFGRGGELLVYDAKTLELLRRIKNPRDGDSSFFGLTGVALHGDRILAAVPQTANNISTAWVFSAKTGEVLLTLDEPDVPTSLSGKPRRSVFGRTLAMNARHIANTANDRDGPTGLNARGIVYVFDAATGSLLYRLKTPGSDKATSFGSSLAMSDNRLYIGSLDETGDLGWPTGQVHAYDLATGELLFTLEDPGVPKNMEEFSAGKEGWGFPTDLSVDGPFLFSGLPDWSGEKQRQGGLIVFDARTGEQLLTYGHRSGEEWGSFGKAIAADHGKLAVMQEISGGSGAAGVVLYRVTVPE